MGLHAVQNAQQILKNGYGVIGIELLAAAQAADLRGVELGRGTKAVHRVIREHIPTLGRGPG